jgi:hypothetical protein
MRPSRSGRFTLTAPPGRRQNPLFANRPPRHYRYALRMRRAAGCVGPQGRSGMIGSPGRQHPAVASAATALPSPVPVACDTALAGPAGLAYGSRGRESATQWSPGWHVRLQDFPAHARRPSAPAQPSVPSATTPSSHQAPYSVLAASPTNTAIARYAHSRFWVPSPGRGRGPEPGADAPLGHSEGRLKDTGSGGEHQADDAGLGAVTGHPARGSPRRRCMERAGRS